MAQLQALLAAALQVGGGRYLTAYQLVRALRRQRIAAPRQANPEAVQLLTVHGAKGLEADTVVLLDAQAAPPRGKNMGILIDWPGEAPAPRQFVFVTSEKDMPPSAVGLAERERFDAAREELNALYVAMTRARQRLMLSSVTPHTQPASSWWQRIEALAEPLGAPSAAHAHTGSSSAPFELLGLPPLQTEHPGASVPSASVPPESAPSEASRLGEAMHWLLEHAGDTSQGWRAERVTQIEGRFGIDADQAARADMLARRILGGEGAWAWDAGQVLEQFNEVELLHQGQRLRIDRLVRRGAGPHGPEAWWVLDYKSAARPEGNPLLQAQMARYRQVVAQAYPALTVMAAFLSADGRMVMADDATLGA